MCKTVIPYGNVSKRICEGCDPETMKQVGVWHSMVGIFIKRQMKKANKILFTIARYSLRLMVALDISKAQSDMMLFNNQSNINKTNCW